MPLMELSSIGGREQKERVRTMLKPRACCVLDNSGCNERSTPPLPSLNLSRVDSYSSSANCYWLRMAKVCPWEGQFFMAVTEPGGGGCWSEATASNYTHRFNSLRSSPLRHTSRSSLLALTFHPTPLLLLTLPQVHPLAQEWPHCSR